MQIVRNKCEVGVSIGEVSMIRFISIFEKTKTELSLVFQDLKMRLLLIWFQFSCFSLPIWFGFDLIRLLAKSSDLGPRIIISLIYVHVF